MLNLVIVLELLGIGLTVTALFLLLNGDGAREQKLLIIMMCCLLVQNVGYLLELTAPVPEAAMTAVTVEKAGAAFLPLCYCWFIYIYCNTAPPKVLLRILGVIGLLSLPAVILKGNGPLYMVFIIGLIIIPYVLSIYVLAKAIYEHADRQLDRQYRTILLLSILPAAALL